jgi:hypothetical protein
MSVIEPPYSVPPIPPGYTAVRIGVVPEVPNNDFTAANDNAGPGLVTTVWTMPRDFEVDMQSVLQAIFAYYNLTDIPIILNGAFEPSQLRSAAGAIVPVITLCLSSDAASRESLGELTGRFTLPNPIVADGIPGDPNATPPIPPIVAPILEAGQHVTLKNQASNVGLDLSVYCLNRNLGKQTYYFIKTALFAAEQTFADLGYLNPPIRTSAAMQTGILDFDGGPKFLYEWQMSYEAKHLDFLAGIDTLASLIAVRSTLADAAAVEPSTAQTVTFATTADPPG